MTERPEKIAYITEQLQNLAIPVDTLLKDPRNAREHPDKNMEAIQASLKKFGQRKPIVVQKTSKGELIVRAGNGTLAATKKLRRDWIAAVVIEEDDHQAMAFAIADNRSAELAAWDEYELSSILSELVDNGFDTNCIGFSDKELTKILDDISGSVSDNLEGKQIVRENPEFLIVISATDESEQSKLYEELVERGVNCKIM